MYVTQVVKYASRANAGRGARRGSSHNYASVCCAYAARHHKPNSTMEIVHDYPYSSNLSFSKVGQFLNVAVD